MTTLHDFFDRHVRGAATALVYDDGFRRWSCTADQVRRAADVFAAHLRDAGVQTGDRIALWGENRPEWVIAFWGCMLHGVAVVPVDVQSSPALAARLITAGMVRGVLVGDDIQPAELPASVFNWRLTDVAMMPDTPEVPFTRATVTPDTVAEIVFTSGTTGDPKGIVITHRNIVANITAFEPAAAKYGPYLWPLRPLRFLALLPLSHMFGQALTMFLPPLVRATSVFVKGYNPDEIVKQIRKHHITLAVTVPRMLEILRGRIPHLAPRCANPPAIQSLLKRLWHFRDAHRLFRWRFCGFVVGGAQLDTDVENFWQRLGFAVIQGYGLTETAPIVAWNDPFGMKHGTVGKPLEGADVRIAPDGEVLVRGPLVTTGYFDTPTHTRAIVDDGWLHTGDLGAFDETGNLRIIGRKKDMIVAADGVKVFPEDVERVLNAMPGVRESAVVAHHEAGAEHVHAVFVLEPSADPAAIVRQANTELESHQRIKEFSVWPEEALPRTEAIGKIKHYQIRQWVESGAARPPESARGQGDWVEQLLSRYVTHHALTAGATLDELGLTSLDRIELMTALEDRAGVALNEITIGSARTIGDLRQAVQAAAADEQAAGGLSLPRWQRSRPARIVRRVSQLTWILPLARIFFRLTVDGREHLRAVRGPVIFAANHQSHFDTPVVLAALSGYWRARIAVPALKEYFDAHFFPERHTFTERLTNSLAYYLAALFFNAFPLPTTEPGMRQTLGYIGELVSDGFSILLFPEGERTEHGEIKPFQSGVGLIGSRLRLPVVPVRLEGVDRVLHRTWNWPRRGDVRVVFGPPMTLVGKDYAALAAQVEHAVRDLRPDISATVADSSEQSPGFFSTPPGSTNQRRGTGAALFRSMENKLWNIVLAAGAGRRLASVTGGVPKQFWSVDGGRTLLEDTLSRSAPLAPPAQNVVVVDRAHESYVAALPQLAQSNRVVYQPRDRGTAVGVLLGLMEVVAVEPHALVLLTPADHGVRRPHSFVAGVRRAALEVDAGRTQVVLFGAAPTEAIGDYGWITPGAPCVGNNAFRPVTAFAEKPVPEAARRLLESGAVWNTMVLLARASALLELYQQHLPALVDSFMPTLNMSAQERPAFLQKQYDQLAATDFSRDLLTHAGGLSLYTWPATLGWSDLGTPDRLARWRATDFAGRTSRALRSVTADQRLQPAS